MAGGVVEVDGGDDEVREGDHVGGFGDEGEEGDEVVVVVVRLVVEDYAGLMGWGVGWWHGFLERWVRSTELMPIHNFRKYLLSTTFYYKKGILSHLLRFLSLCVYY